EPLRGPLGNHRIPAESGRRHFLAEGGRRLHTRQLPGAGDQRRGAPGLRFKDRTFALSGRAASPQAPHPLDNFASAFRRNRATRHSPAAGGNTDSASSVFSRSRTDKRRQTLNTAQTQTINPTNSDSISAPAQRNCGVVSDQGSDVGESKKVARHQNRVAP